MKRSILLMAAVIGVAATGVLSAGQGPGADRLSADALKGLELRSIGPALATGRIADVAIDSKNPNIWYVASAFGGLWKTVNRGITFTPVFDDGGSFTLCCVVIDPKDSNVVWLGTGENLSQRSAHFGDGIYKSTDAGKTWKRMGLATSEHIGKVLIDPRNSNVVYVAAQGPLWSAGGERGLYKTTDGGATWKAVLTISADTGVNDIVFDPKNADILYASAYQRRRAVGQLIGGGPESGIYKTTNGGSKWTKLTKGLPKEDTGRIALAIDGRKSPATCSRSSARSRPKPASIDRTMRARAGRGSDTWSSKAAADAAGPGGRAGRAGAGRGAGGAAHSRSLAGAAPPTTSIAAAIRITTSRSSSIRIAPTRSGR